MFIHLKKSRSGALGLRSLMHLRRGRALGVVFAAAVLACGGDSTSPESIEGTYTLETINARASVLRITAARGFHEAVLAEHRASRRRRAFG
jgi:hypothetical protein